MIYGLPGHTEAIIREDNRIMSSLGVTQVSDYPLYYYENATISRRGEREENVAMLFRMYDEVVDSLVRAGYIQYGREYFSDTLSHRHHYQEHFVENGRLAGFGHSAYSFNGERAWYREQKFSQYLNMKSPIVREYRYESESLDRRLIVLGSRYWEIDTNRLGDRETLRTSIDLAVRMGYLEETADKLLLTPKGIKYHDIVAHIFF